MNWRIARNLTQSGLTFHSDLNFRNFWITPRASWSFWGLQGCKITTRLITSVHCKKKQTNKKNPTTTQKGILYKSRVLTFTQFGSFWRNLKNSTGSLILHTSLNKAVDTWMKEEHKHELFNEMLEKKTGWWWLGGGVCYRKYLGGGGKA